EQVISFLASYSAVGQPCFQMNASKLREYIRARTNDGELTDWTVALVSKEERKGVQRARIGKFGVTLNYRGADEPLNEFYRIGQLAGREEETFDLSTTEFQKAQADSKVTGSELPTRTSVRDARPPRRGLLLLYPLT